MWVSQNSVKMIKFSKVSHININLSSKPQRPLLPKQKHWTLLNFFFGFLFHAVDIARVFQMLYPLEGGDGQQIMRGEGEQRIYSRGFGL